MYLVFLYLLVALFYLPLFISSTIEMRDQHLPANLSFFLFFACIEFRSF